MKNIKEYFIEYNNYVERYKKACIYLNNNNVSIADKEKWLPEFQRINEKLQSILDILDFYKIGYDEKEIENGFDIDTRMGETA